MFLSPVTVLIVEDEGLLCELMVGELETLGFIVFKAQTAEEALTLMEGEKPVDVLFTDIRLPGALDGIDLARYVKEHHPTVRVLLASAHMPRSELPENLAELIDKPYRSANVLRAIQNLLDNKRGS